MNRKIENTEKQKLDKVILGMWMLDLPLIYKFIVLFVMETKAK